MSFHIDLEYASSPDDTDAQKRLFGVIKAGLGRPGDVSTKAAALADHLRALGGERKSIGEAAKFIGELCSIVVGIAHATPPDHPWQDTLVQAVQNLQRTDVDVGQFDEAHDLDWKHLPQLRIYMRDFWFDPTSRDDWTPEQVSDWENCNSFAARLITDTFVPWPSFPIWQLRSALEEKLDKGPVLDSRLWIATEWILCCGEIFFKIQVSGEELDESTARAWSTGSLCQGIAPLSLERLAFWKKRLLEMSGEKEALGLSDELAERVAKAAEKIGEFESRQSS